MCTEIRNSHEELDLLRLHLLVLQRENQLVNTSNMFKKAQNSKQFMLDLLTVLFKIVTLYLVHTVT